MLNSPGSLPIRDLLVTLDSLPLSPPESPIELRLLKDRQSWYYAVSRSQVTRLRKGPRFFDGKQAKFANMSYNVTDF